MVDCYGDKKVEINLEVYQTHISSHTPKIENLKSLQSQTKIDPVAPNETLPLKNYINDIVPILEKKNFAKRTYIQSFDWRTIIGIKQKFPKIRTVALLDDTTIIPFDRGVGGYPWLGGINV